METVSPPPSQPKKRGRPKGSTKAKADTDREASAAASGGVPRMRGADKRSSSSDEKYSQWKSLVPVLYDWLANHNLVWPSLSCRCVLFPRPLLSSFLFFLFFVGGPRVFPWVRVLHLFVEDDRMHSWLLL